MMKPEPMMNMQRAREYQEKIGDLQSFLSVASEHANNQEYSRVIHYLAMAIQTSNTLADMKADEP